MKRLLLNVVFATLFAILLVSDNAYAESAECPPLTMDIEHCGYESWYHLAEGVSIGAFLGLLFHHLSHKQNEKIGTIIRQQEELRKRRRIQPPGQP